MTVKKDSSYAVSVSHKISHNKTAVPILTLIFNLIVETYRLNSSSKWCPLEINACITTTATSISGIAPLLISPISSCIVPTQLYNLRSRRKRDTSNESRTRIGRCDNAEFTAHRWSPHATANVSRYLTKETIKER